MEILADVSQKKKEELIAPIQEQKQENQQADKQAEISFNDGNLQQMAEHESEDQKQPELKREEAKKALLEGFKDIGTVISGTEKVINERGYGDILGVKEKGSASFEQMKAAGARLMELYERISKNEEVDSGTILEAVMSLGEAANGYYDLHRGHRDTGKGKARKTACFKIKELVRSFYEKLELTAYGKVSGLREDPEISYDDAERYSKKTEQHLLLLADRYEKWGKHFGFQEGRERAKIKDKANLFAPFEEDIRAYESYHKLRSREYNPKLKAIIDTWHEYNRKERVLSYFEQEDAVKEKLEDPLEAMIITHVHKMDEREKDEEELSNEEMDKNLTPEQIEKVEEIDQWFFRNYYNAGAVGRLFTARNHHGEIISELFKRSKRERMFIYYLIESGKRKDPQVMDAFYSQTSYVPSLKNFKKAMLASKLKVISHMTGSYVYMNKLTDALFVNGKYKRLVKKAALLEDERIGLGSQKKKGDEQKDKEPAGPDEIRRNLLLDFYSVNVDYRNLLLATDREKDKDKKAALQKRVAAKGAEAEEVRRKLFEADDRFEKSLTVKDALRPNTDVEDINTYSGLVGLGLDKAGDKQASIGWGLSQSALANKNLYVGSYGASALSLLSQSIAVGAALCSLYDNAGNMHAGDIGMNVVQILHGMSKEGYTLWKAAESAKHYGKQIVGGGSSEYEISKGLKITGIAVASAAVGISAYKTASGGLDIRNAKKASHYFKNKYEGLTDKENNSDKEKRERRYEENMAALAEMMSAHKTKFSALDTISNSITLSSLMIPGIGSLIATGIGAAASIGTAIGDAVFMSYIQEAMFDQYFNIDGLYNDAIDKAKARNRPIHDQKEFKEQLRRRAAAAAGYSDTATAADHIAKKYAIFVHDKLFGAESIKDEKERDGYIQLVKAFGLRYDEKKKRPDVYHLSRKMSGR